MNKTKIILGAFMISNLVSLNAIPLQTSSGRSKNQVTELNGEWKFGGKNLPVKKELLEDYSQWQTITIPHTWNALDGEDGGNNYVRDSFWYHKDFDVDLNENHQFFIEFNGVNQRADVYVNGQKAGEAHKGGYTVFRYNITTLLQNGKNSLDVRVDNRQSQEVAPISADFNMCGGIYRRVYLITVPETHFDLEDSGSSGIYLETGNCRSKTKPSDFGKLNVKTTIKNESSQDKEIQISAKIEGENAPSPKITNLKIKANSSADFSTDFKIENPVLWNHENPYLYKVTLAILENGNQIDELSDKTGFRYFYVDSKDGFFLNGQKYPLRGVNRHSFRKGVGNALTEEMHDEDIKIIKELGANCIRLCHYPQTDYFYDLCDENGIILWSEIPFVNMVGDSEKFEANLNQQLTKLIKQQYNRPSIIFWGLENEVGNGTSLTDSLSNPNVAKMKGIINRLDKKAKELDKSGRYTTQAVNRDFAMNQKNPSSVDKNFEDNTGWKSDTIAWNIYPGWYPDANFYGTFQQVMERKIAKESRPMGISEYGWGANPFQHEENPALGKNNLQAGSQWHPEEYQNLMNEEALKYINSHDELWATFYWVMFDFAVDARNEGGQIALNDKGLVTADRKIKKDSFYLYKANWNKTDKFTYITSRRWTERKNHLTNIKVYSNCNEVELILNGNNLGKMNSLGNGIFVLEKVQLNDGENKILATGDSTYKDECTFTGL